MSQLPSLFLNNLLPIFLAIAAGYILVKRFKANPRTLSQVSFYIFSPCLIFNLLINSELSGGDIGQMSLFAFLTMIGTGLVAGLAGLLFRLDRRTLAALLIASILVNAGNYGLPLLLFAFDETVLAYGTVYFIVMAVMAYTVGVFVASMGTLSPAAALRNLLRVPVLYAVLLALFFMLTGWSLPIPVARTAEMLAGAAIPAMLVLMGMQFPSMKLNGQALPISLGVGVRLLAGPLIGFGLARLMQLPIPAFQAGIIQSGMPSAVVNTVLATEYEAEPALVTAMVFISTVLSPLTITPLLALLGG